MPETDSYLRAGVFTLLVDTDFRLRPDTGTFSHYDGRPFTDEEQATVLLANRDELEATLEVRLLIDTEIQKKVGTAGLNIVLAPYDDQPNEDFTLGDVITHRPQDGPSDIERLAYVMNGFVPDGQ
ncbi:hypothetical protein ACFZDF_13130 [Streptomyces sp. NPDC007910]|uniref:hypothetical protein n=1 Tax=Streptomyces sp. NPDC007910 TaxID=3364790 RepID=UPI0036E53ADD